MAPLLDLSTQIPQKPNGFSTFSQKTCPTNRHRYKLKSTFFQPETLPAQDHELAGDEIRCENPWFSHLFATPSRLAFSIPRKMSWPGFGGASPIWSGNSNVSGPGHRDLEWK